MTSPLRHHTSTALAAALSFVVVFAFTAGAQPKPPKLPPPAQQGQSLTAGNQDEKEAKAEGTVAQTFYWPKPYKISVCFRKTKFETPEYRKWVREAADDSWAALSDIKFDWFDCDDDKKKAAKAIRITFRALEDSRGSWPGIGQPEVDCTWYRDNLATPPADWTAKKIKDALQSCEEGMKFNFGKPGETTEDRARATSVHEFGHALGFDHEQVLGDKRSKACQQTKDEKEQAATRNTSQSITDYDPSSVMNYCYEEAWVADDKWLSRLDIQGLQKIYGNGGLDMNKSCTSSDQCPYFHGAGARGGVCCNGKCAQAERDHFGVYYCPDVCVGAAGGSPGTCPRKDDGEACKVSADCILDGSGSACCGGVCSPMKKDFAGVLYCKNDCVGRLGASPGTCPLIEDGEACKANADCEDFNGLGKEGSACCGGECQPMKKDWAGVYYCAAECKGSAGAAGGTCGKKKAKGEACSDNAQCDGFNGLGKKGSACCGGKCAPLKKDWAGVYYCKADCVGASGASKGTCPLKEKGDSCKVGADCEGSLSCCSGKCRKKKKDWAGVKYCPNECVGKPGGKPGSCD